MASIPLPALNIRPAEDPLSQYAKALSVQSMIGGQQLQREQISGAQQENQIRAQQIKDQQATTAAMQEWDGKTFSDLPPLIIKHGGSSTAVIGLQKSAQELQLQKSTIAKNDAETGAKNLETKEKNNNMLLGHLTTLNDESDEDLPSALQREKNAALLGGYLAPEQSAAIDRLASLNDPKQIRTSLAVLEKSLMGQKEQFDQAYKERDLASKEWKEIPGTNQFYNTRTNELRTPAGVKMTPQQAEAQYIALASQKASGQALSDDEQAAMKGFEQYKKIIPQFQINNQFTGAGFGPNAGGDVPANLRGQVQAILDYRAPIPPQGRNNPVNTAVRQWVNQLDPTYDETTFPQRNKILSEYVKSAGEGQIGAINTALGHLNELEEARKALSSKDLPLLHSIASKVGAAFGNDAPTTYQMILHRVGPEMTAAYVKGGGGEGERGANTADFDLTKGDKQIASNIRESANLLNSKLASQRNNWENTFKPSKDSDHFDARFITPDAKAILNTLSGGKGGGGSKFTLALPNGKTASFPTQAALDAFKKEAGLP